MKQQSNVSLITIEVNEELDVLSRSEIAEEIGELRNEIDQLEKEKALAMRDHKTRIDTPKNRLNLLLEILSKGYETKDVQCYEEKDFESDAVIFIDNETGKEVKRRQMTNDDRQKKITDFNDGDDQ